MKFLQGMTLLSIGLSIWLLGCTTLPNSSATSPSAMPTNPPSSQSTRSNPANPTTTTPASPNSASPAPTSATPVPANSNRRSNPGQNSGQSLPISAQADIKGQTIQLEVARSPQEQAMGLMHRPALPDDRGMLFPLNPPRRVQFWMKNVPVGLDMIFLQDGEVKAIETAPPCTANPCPTYGPRVAIDQVIEMRAGRAAELGLAVGDRITIQFLDTQSDRSSRFGFGRT